MNPDQYRYMDCRAIGHSWRVSHWGKASDSPVPLPDAPLFGRTWATVRVLTCDVCGMVRTDFFMAGTKDPSETWRVVNRRYSRPKDYHYPELNRRSANEHLFQRFQKKAV